MLVGKPSLSQVHYFFAIAKILGYSSMVIKERAKEKYALTSFSEITTNQLNFLIDKLKDVAHTRGINLDEYRHTHTYICECGHKLEEANQ